MENKKQIFGIIIGTRGFFNAALAEGERAKIIALMERLGYGYVLLDSVATPSGSGTIESSDDAAQCARLFKAHRGEISGVIVMLPNFGDEIAVVSALREAALNVPVLVQATDDDIDKGDYSRRRDAFCGKISVCNNLVQYGIPFSLTVHHTTAVDSPRFADDVREFAAVCRIVNGVRTVRLGAIGARPASFQTMRYSEKLLEACGATVVTVDLSEIMARAKKQDSKSADMQAKIEQIRGYGHIASTIPAERIGLQAALCLAVETWMAQNRIKAAGVQCWQSIQFNYGCAACLAMSMLSEAGIPCACEVDVPGALSMYALMLAGERAPALMDWNNNYGDDPDKCVAQHCSNFAKSFVNAPIEISHLDVMGRNIGNDICFGAVMGKVAAGPMTYCRISTDDRAGLIKAYCGNGEFTDDVFDMKGGVSVCRINEMQKLFQHICLNGFEHHVAMVRGHHARVINEAFTKYLSWPVYLHE